MDISGGVDFHIHFYTVATPPARLFTRFLGYPRYAGQHHRCPREEPPCTISTCPNHAHTAHRATICPHANGCAWRMFLRARRARWWQLFCVRYRWSICSPPCCTHSHKDGEIGEERAPEGGARVSTGNHILARPEGIEPPFTV